MSITFAQMGFGPTVTGSSATPAADGYVGTLNAMPYHIHPTATPDAYAALEASIAADAVTVISYVPPPAPSAAQMAANAMTMGLAVTSTSTPAINDTYACDQLSQMDIIAIETSLNAGKGFPGGAAAFNYPDLAGVMHSFTAANFTDFAAAIRDYVYALKSVIAGASTALPAATSTIA
jgi:hypothetical protein